MHIRWLSLPAFVCICVASVSAQDLNERIAALETATKAAQSSADNAWVLMCSALVLLMTIPGLALFYGGLVRQKNVISTMLKSLICVGIATLLWVIFGYSLVFSEGNQIIGGFGYAFLSGVGAEPNPDYAANIPQQTFMIFQLMFAVITPALITGAFAERIRFPAKIAFTSLWLIVVYYPLAHMVWGKGGLLNAALGGAIPSLDFAGGTVVHISSGVSALVCAIYLGRRVGYQNTPTPPHSVVLSLIGASLLWFGWFGFNAGSALSANALATSAFVTTHLSAASAMLAWICIDWFRNGKPSAIGAISGAVAGLVGITPAAGFVTPLASILIGIVVGSVCFFMVVKVKQILGYDDTLDVFGIHGIGGAVGAIAVGIFATSAINPIFKDASGNPLPVGMLEGNPDQIINQLAGILIAVLLGSIGTFVLLKIVDLLIGLRVSETDEITGLDATQHGEKAYIFDPSKSLVNAPTPSKEKAHGSVEDIIPTQIPAESQA